MQDNVNALGVLEVLLRTMVNELKEDVAETAHYMATNFLLSNSVATYE